MQGLTMVQDPILTPKFNASVGGAVIVQKTLENRKQTRSQVIIPATDGRANGGNVHSELRTAPTETSKSRGWRET
jgi:hypothetical protein